jgi:mannose-6-phosphate isomerase-like protein (cupin superfamily)
MKILSKHKAPRYTRTEGITSYLLASPRTSDARFLTTTMVEITPGGKQRVHQHHPEQVYFILEGKGLMTVADKRAEVGPADCIFIPSGVSHGLKNNGKKLLRYFSAAAPSFKKEELESFWPLDSLAQ